MTLTYSIKHLRRHFREGILSVALVLVITVLLLGLLHFLDGQETQLAYVYDTFEIECVLSNATGTQTKEISIPANVADMFLDGGALTPYVMSGETRQTAAAPPKSAEEYPSAYSIRHPLRASVPAGSFVATISTTVSGRGLRVSTSGDQRIAR